MEQLVLSILGTDNSATVSELFKLIAHCHCDVNESRMNILGNEFTASLLLSGSWNALAKFEASLPAFEKKHDLKVLARRTQANAPQISKLPYSSYIVALSQPTAVYKILQFLHEQGVDVRDMSVTTYQAPRSGAQMLGIGLSFNIPGDRLVADFREQFILFCDDNNFDAAMEPQKN